MAHELNVGDISFDPSIALATYDAGAKLDWRIHPGDQMLARLMEKAQMRNPNVWVRARIARLRREIATLEAKL